MERVRQEKINLILCSDTNFPNKVIVILSKWFKFVLACICENYGLMLEALNKNATPVGMRNTYLLLDSIY